MHDSQEHTQKRARSGTRRKSHLVYFAEAVGLNLIKIGVAADVAKRLEGLRTGCPVPIKLLGTMPGDVEIERFLHQDLAPHRTHGEWFRKSPEVEHYVDCLDKPRLPSESAQRAIDWEKRTKAHRQRLASRATARPIQDE